MKYVLQMISRGFLVFNAKRSEGSYGSDKANSPMYMENISKQHEPFTGQEKASIAEYGNVLRSIHNRLVSEGYFLPCGKIWNIFKCASYIVEVEIEVEN